MDRAAWWATVHGVTKSWTQLKRLSTRQYTCLDVANVMAKLKFRIKDTSAIAVDPHALF